MTFNSDSASYSSSAIAFAADRDEPERRSDLKTEGEAAAIFDTMTCMSEASDAEEAISREPGDREVEVSDPTLGNRLHDSINPRDIAVLQSYYIQAAQHNHRAFLTTNLSSVDAAQVTALSSTWLIGRSRNCAIVVHDRSVSRCHAVVGYDVQQGFYLMDVGSSNGTYLNQKRLSVLKRYSLRDGDVIMLCNLQFEFFIAS
jgi:copper chaperone CopZ